MLLPRYDHQANKDQGQGSEFSDQESDDGFRRLEIPRTMRKSHEQREQTLMNLKSDTLIPASGF